MIGYIICLMIGFTSGFFMAAVLSAGDDVRDEAD